ncbi:MAG: protein phosphatase CheZ [Desulfovibrionales bacterium]
MDKKEILDNILERITADALVTFRETMTRIIDEEFARTLTQALTDSQFYKTLNDELRTGLSSIYREIHSAKGEDESSAPPHQDDTRELFSEASDQLDQIRRTTEEATVEIMDILEKHMDRQTEVERLLKSLDATGNKKDAVSRLLEMNDQLGRDLMSIMTTLSFQDLTGQRIKRIVETLRKVEETVFDLYMSSGLVLKARAEHPDKDLDELREESRMKVSTLKGPQTEASQTDVDDLLNQLGLD